MTTEVKTIYEKLVGHLVEIEEEKSEVIEEYYYEMSAERLEFETLMIDYVSRIDSYMKDISDSKEIGTDCPFVLIDSIVEVEDISNKEVERFKIVSPFLTTNPLDGDFASYLSPIGKSLLLKKVGDHVLIETPMENIEYVIKSIELD
ncbi:MAG: GreA/GreB family elongation factor [Tissierellales bacterium]